MEWTLKDTAGSGASTTSLGHDRKSSRAGLEHDVDWNYSERNVPPPRVIHGNTLDEQQTRDEGLSEALSTIQYWGADTRQYVKIWDRFQRQINSSVFRDQHGNTDAALHGHIQTIGRQYLRRYPAAVHENIWFDIKNQSLFSNAQTYCTGLDPIEHTFCTTRTNFVNQTWTSIASEMGRMIEDMTVCYNALGQRPNAKGVTHEDIQSGRCYGDLVFPDLRIGVCPVISNMTNQDSVLIVGGGPSSKNIDFSKYTDIPVWTMNNYFNNPMFDQFSNIQAACFLDEVSIFNNDKLWEYVNDRDTIVFQEITDYGPERLNYVKNTANHSTYFHTRYRSKLGVGARMLITAIILGIKDIYFCGFDGYDMNLTADNHSFEEGKKIPNWLAKSGPPVQNRQYVMLWDYILNHISINRSLGRTAYTTIQFSGKHN